MNLIEKQSSLDRGGSSTPKRAPLDAILIYVESTSILWQFSRRTQLGLYYLAQHACDAGFHVRVDCLSANDDVVRRIQRLSTKHSCRTFGFYVDQDNLWDVRRILAGLRERGVILNVIVGGPQITAAAELTMERLPDATVGVIGEGEETFVELLRLRSFARQDLLACLGLAVPSPDGVVRTPPRPPLEDLDRLSIPDRRKLTLDQSVKPMPLMIAGRGCTGTCAFCFEGRKHHPGKKLRLHSAERCLEEFDYLVKMSKGSYISILDDTFVADGDRLKRFCNGLIDRYNGEIAWFCEARADTLAQNTDILPLMVKAGLIRVQIGGESGCQEILDAYKKRTTLEQMWAVVDSARDHGLLSVYLNFITGGAFESRETAARTRDFAVELLRRAPGCVGVGNSLFTPYPGTPMSESPESFGIRVVDPETVTGIGDNHVFCRTEALTRLEILELSFDFRQAVQSAMASLCDDLPFECMKRHFEASCKWNLATEWYDQICQDRAVYGYLESIYRCGGRVFDEVKRMGLSKGYPVRNVDLVASREGRYLVSHAAGTARELDELESALAELSAGKLNAEEIIGLLSDRYPQQDGEALRRAIVTRFEALDRECIVVWRTNDRSKPRIKRWRDRVRALA